MFQIIKGIFSMLFPTQIWLCNHPWSLGWDPMQYGSWTLIQICDKSWQDLRSSKAQLVLSRMACHEWIGYWLDQHAHHDHIQCIQGIGPCSCWRHFSKLAYRLCCPRVWRTCWMCYKCSSQLLLKTRVSSRYTTTKELVKGCNMPSINIMKFVGEFIKPKGMTNHSKIHFLDLKTFFHTSFCSMGTWWYL